MWGKWMYREEKQERSIKEVSWKTEGEKIFCTKKQTIFYINVRKMRLNDVQVVLLTTPFHKSRSTCLLIELILKDDIVSNTVSLYPPKHLFMLQTNQ